MRAETIGARGAGVRTDDAGLCLRNLELWAPGVGVRTARGLRADLADGSSASWPPDDRGGVPGGIRRGDRTLGRPGLGDPGDLPARAGDRPEAPGVGLGRVR